MAEETITGEKTTRRGLLKSAGAAACALSGIWMFDRGALAAEQKPPRAQHATVKPAPSKILSSPRFRIRIRLSGDGRDVVIWEFRRLQPGEPIVYGARYYIERDDGKATVGTVEKAAGNLIVIRSPVRTHPPLSIDRCRIAGAAIVVADIDPVPVLDIDGPPVRPYFRRKSL